MVIVWIFAGRTATHTEQILKAIGLNRLLQLVVVVRVLSHVFLDLPLNSLESHHERSLARTRRSSYCVGPLVQVVVELPCLNRRLWTLPLEQIHRPLLHQRHLSEALALHGVSVEGKVVRHGIRVGLLLQA